MFFSLSLSVCVCSMLLLQTSIVFRKTINCLCVLLDFPHYFVALIVSKRVCVCVCAYAYMLLLLAVHCPLWCVCRILFTATCRPDNQLNNCPLIHFRLFSTFSLHQHTASEPVGQLLIDTRYFESFFYSIVDFVLNNYATKCLHYIYVTNQYSSLPKYQNRRLLQFSEYYVSTRFVSIKFHSIKFLVPPSQPTIF